MATLEDAKHHIVKLIVSIEDYDEHEKIHSLVHSLEAICYCLQTERAMMSFSRPQMPDGEGQWPDQF